MNGLVGTFWQKLLIFLILLHFFQVNNTHSSFHILYYKILDAIARTLFLKD